MTILDEQELRDIQDSLNYSCRKNLAYADYLIEKIKQLNQESVE